ncbi:hypothetical protein OROMI_002517 [Orobanche minor]
MSEKGSRNSQRPLNRITQSGWWKHNPRAPTHYDLTREESSGGSLPTAGKRKEKGAASASSKKTIRPSKQAKNWEPPNADGSIDKETHQPTPHSWLDEEVTFSHPAPPTPLLLTWYEPEEASTKLTVESNFAAESRAPSPTPKINSQPPDQTGEREQVQKSAPPPVRGKRKSLLGLPNRFNVAFGSPGQVTRYSELQERKVIPLIFLDEVFLQEAGLYEDVMKLLKVLGWDKVVTGNWEIYENLTYEFFSSIQIRDLEENGTFYFRLNGRGFTWGTEQFCRALGLPDDPETEEEIPSVNDIWRMITKNARPFTAGKTKATAIRNPAVRYVQRLMAHTITGRYSNRNVVQNFELKMLYAMISGKKVKFSKDLLRFFIGEDETNNPIVMGGFVTAMARHAGIDLSGRFPIGPVEKLGKMLLTKMGVFEKCGNFYKWRISEMEKISLPNSEFTSPWEEQNLKMSHSSLPDSPSKTPGTFIPAAGANTSRAGDTAEVTELRRRIEQLEEGQRALQARVDHLTELLGASLRH